MRSVLGRVARKWWRPVVAGLLLLLGWIWLMPSVVELRSDSVLDAIFASRRMIGGARLLTLLGGAYLVASIFARAARGEWARRVGPVDAGESVKDVTDDQSTLQEELDSARAVIAEQSGEIKGLMSVLDGMTQTTDSDASSVGVAEGTARDTQGGQDDSGGPAQEGPEGA